MVHKTLDRRRKGKTITGRNQARRVRDYINGVKSKGCQLCGYSKCISAIEFHHVEGGKEFELSSAGSRSLISVEREIAKCIRICANCHREIHGESVGLVNREVVESDQTKLVLYEFTNDSSQIVESG
jgi:hypothetical protein